MYITSHYKRALWYVRSLASERCCVMCVMTQIARRSATNVQRRAIVQEIAIHFVAKFLCATLTNILFIFVCTIY